MEVRSICIPLMRADSASLLCPLSLRARLLYQCFAAPRLRRAHSFIENLSYENKKLSLKDRRLTEKRKLTLREISKKASLVLHRLSNTVTCVETQAPQPHGRKTATTPTAGSTRSPRYRRIPTQHGLPGSGSAMGRNHLRMVIMAHDPPSHPILGPHHHLRSNASRKR